MRKTSIYVFGLLLILISQLIHPNMVQGITWPLVDEVDDVFQMENLQPVARGDFHDELDIVNATIVNTNLIVTFQAPPIIGGGRTYGGYIYWWGATNIYNWTGWRIGLDLFSHTPTNYVEIDFTYTTNGSGYSRRVYDVVTIEGTSLVFPILNHTLLPNFPNPPHFFFAAGLLDDIFLLYVDHLPEMFAWTPTTPPTTPETTETSRFISSFSIFLALFTVAVVYRRRCKRK